MSLKDLNRAAQEAFLETAQFIVKTDGIIAAQEAQRMSMYRREFGISPEDYPADGKGNQLEEAIDILKKLPKYERIVVFEELERLAKCDDEYNDSEKIVINALKDMLEV